MRKKIQVYTKSRTMNLGTVDNYKLGVENDNNVDTLVFELDEMIKGQASLLTSLKGEDGILAPIPLTEIENGYELMVTREMLTQSKIQIQLQITNENMTWHSLTYVLEVASCLETGTGEIPSGISIWLETADLKLLEINSLETSISSNESQRQENEAERVQKFNEYEEIIKSLNEEIKILKERLEDYDKYTYLVMEG